MFTHRFLPQLRGRVSFQMSQSSSPQTEEVETVHSKIAQMSLSSVDSWPGDARPLKERNWLSYLYTFGDVVLVLMPIYFVRE